MSAGGQHGGQPDAMAQLRAQGPPYPPQGASLGGMPTTTLDIPVSAVLAFVFALSAAVNMTMFQLNKHRGHKFVFSAVLFGFSMARVSSNLMRIVWACYPRNARVAIAASILANAGVIALFIVNLFFVQRVLRAFQPRLGWSRPVRIAFRSLIASVVACLVMVIVSIVYSFYTLDPSKHAQLRDVQLVAVVFLAVLAFLPIPIALVAMLLPRRGHSVENFGSGTMRTKVRLLLFTSLILTLGAGFRAGVAFVQRPADSPAWFHHKACFYCFSYLIELIVVFTYVVSRFDRRFHIPDGSSQPGHYSTGVPAAEKKSANYDGFASDDQQGQQMAWDERLRGDIAQQREASARG
ncbi:putative family c-likeG-protein-coupled receptor protein [Hirsutella rhossiliensis]|uniref:Family c-likeg-protein-coupled receptor protein n=1 Tax=Hirsutella rhossiliensis TaxID=111463 RepID=A0A9P8SLA6_9HYPO|nr:putative family c-likeg-protein-coupled receptor protein [Hirsutella rhossiliensis]KAH0965615.1 putative family c-likeg-protein-coupled receptor protein [Hirsutella rhossiliensis]